jgi:methionine synthase II (cobalamin-independent)
MGANITLQTWKPEYGINKIAGLIPEAEIVQYAVEMANDLIAQFPEIKAELWHNMIGVGVVRMTVKYPTENREISVMIFADNVGLLNVYTGGEIAEMTIAFEW